MTVKSLSETGMAQNTVAEIQGESKYFMKCLFVGSSFLSLFSSFLLSKYIAKSIALKMGPRLNFQLHLYHLRYHSILLLLILLFL